MSTAQTTTRPPGSDEVEFLISTNPGSIPPRPLGEVASGGELSRIMLATKTVLADTDDIPTLIFDEIDTGISRKNCPESIGTPVLHRKKASGSLHHPPSSDRRDG